MANLKVTSWSVAYLDRLTDPQLALPKQRRRDAVVQEIRELDPDILLTLEGPG